MTKFDSAAAASPFRMGRVALTVHDLDKVGDFYQRAAGLRLLSRDGESARLGAGGETLLELRLDKAARRRSSREAGLFHTAFLLPSRADLGRFLRHVVETRIPVSGASDHVVSEAIYLQDPEGNGVEIYADRPASQWTWNGGQVHMSTDPLNAQDLAASAGDTVWAGFPEGSTVGHVHLQVGAIPAAEAFYSGVLGLPVTSRYPGGSFYAANGYHHHLATNIWNSRGASVREEPSTGLAEVEILLDPARAEAIRGRAGAETLALKDPWGTRILLNPA